VNAGVAPRRRVLRSSLPWAATGLLGEEAGRPEADLQESTGERNRAGADLIATQGGDVAPSSATCSERAPSPDGEFTYRDAAGNLMGRSARRAVRRGALDSVCEQRGRPSETTVERRPWALTPLRVALPLRAPADAATGRGSPGEPLCLEGTGPAIAPAPPRPSPAAAARALEIEPLPDLTAHGRGNVDAVLRIRDLRRRGPWLLDQEPVWPHVTLGKYGKRGNPPGRRPLVVTQLGPALASLDSCTVPAHESEMRSNRATEPRTLPGMRVRHPSPMPRTTSAHLYGELHEAVTLEPGPCRSSDRYRVSFRSVSPV
jgi:hypothetical protein